MAQPILHLIAGSIDFYALWYDQKYINVNLVKGLDGYPFKNRILFLTMWTLALQTVYMGFALLNDVFGTNDASPIKPPIIRQIKDVLFSVAYPVGVYVSLAFWSIYFINKELIYPERIKKAYPQWLNHVMHTLVAVFINIEMFTANIDYPSKKVNLTMGYIFILSYIAYISFVYSKTGLWPYGVLGYLKWPSKVFLIVGSFVFGNIVNYFACELCHVLNSSKYKIG